MWACVLVEPLLLLFLLLDHQASHPRPLKDTMGPGADDWDGAVGAAARAADMEHESICGRLEQLRGLGRENLRWEKGTK